MLYWKFILCILSYFTTNCMPLTTHSRTGTIPPHGNESEERIIRGFPCSLEDLPFMVLLVGRFNSPDWMKLCGGTLVSASWVLTAAHCIVDPHGKYMVLASFDVRTRKYSVVEVEQILLHPLYSLIEYTHDIALLKLRHRLEKSRHVDYVNLPTSRSQSSHSLCDNAMITGWGLVNDNEIPELDDLQCAMVPILEYETCHKMYKNYHGLRITSSQMCTLSTEGIDACRGDSGGPLLCANNTQVGIISWGIECGKPLSPGVYTRTDLYVEFIQGIIKAMDDKAHSHSSILYLVIILSFVII